MPMSHWENSPNREDRLLFDIYEDVKPGVALSPVSELGILAFAQEQWGPRTFEKIALKACGECGEFAEAISKTEEGRATLEDADMEVGDVLFVLSQYAAKRGTTLDALRAKAYQKCKERVIAAQEDFPFDPPNEKVNYTFEDSEQIEGRLHRRKIVTAVTPEDLFIHMSNGSFWRPVSWANSPTLVGAYCFIGSHTFTEKCPLTVGVTCSPAIAGVRDAIRKYGDTWERFETPPAAPVDLTQLKSRITDGTIPGVPDRFIGFPPEHAAPYGGEDPTSPSFNPPEHPDSEQCPNCDQLHANCDCP